MCIHDPGYTPFQQIQVADQSQRLGGADQYEPSDGDPGKLR